MYDAKGKFGRILGEIFNLYGAIPSTRDVDNPGSTPSANQLLIDNSHAVKYHGQSKEDIAETHLTNRKLVKLDEESDG